MPPPKKVSTPHILIDNDKENVATDVLIKEIKETKKSSTSRQTRKFLTSEQTNKKRGRISYDSVFNGGNASKKSKIISTTSDSADGYSERSYLNDSSDSSSIISKRSSKKHCDSQSIREDVAQLRVEQDKKDEKKEKKKEVDNDDGIDSDSDAELDPLSSPKEKDHMQPEDYMQEEWQMERIMSKKKISGRWKYLIKWLDWHPSTCSWELAAHINTPVEERSCVKSYEKRVKFHDEVRQFLPKSDEAKKWKLEIIEEEDGKAIAKNHPYLWKLHAIETIWQNAADKVGAAEIFIENWTGDGALPSIFEYIVDVVRSEQVVDILESLAFAPNDMIRCSCENGCGVIRLKSDKNETNMCCLERTGGEGCRYNTRGLLSRKDLLDNGDVVECGASCMCDKENCSQRVVQCGRTVAICVFREESLKGWGVRAVESIKQGQFVIEYVGELITNNEVETENRKLTYLWDITNPIPGHEKFALDARKKGNAARFINHSCDPNLISKEVITDKYGFYCSRIAFFAARNIAIGEELTFNYSPEGNEKSGGKCLCGATNCCGKIP